jgi:hypothetical protein
MMDGLVPVALHCRVIRGSESASARASLLEHPTYTAVDVDAISSREMPAALRYGQGDCFAFIQSGLLTILQRMINILQ